MFLAKPGIYKPAGLFSFNHVLILIMSIISIFYGIKRTKIKNNEDIRLIIKKITIIVWFLEILKIIFNLFIGNGYNVNTYVPLYFCSLLLYAGIFSGWCNNYIKRVGDVFLITGGIIAGVAFLIFPTTSLTTYPLFHFLSFHSFFYHSIMIYLGLIMIKNNYIKLEKKDIFYYSSLIFVVCMLALIVNNICDSNLMFISKYFEPLSFIYNLLGKYYTLFMILAQMILPFYFMYYLLKLKK